MERKYKELKELATQKGLIIQEGLEILEKSSLFQKYCQLCGHYHNWINEELEVDLIDANHIEELGIIIEKYFKGTCEKNKLYKEIISTTWKHIFEKYEVEKPTMIKY